MMTALVDHLWQSTLCVVVAWLLTLALRNNAASVRYWVWFAASIKFLIPFSLLSSLGSQFSLRSEQVAPLTQSLVGAIREIAEPLATPAISLRVAPTSTPTDWAMWLLVLWGIGCAALASRWLVHWTRVRGAMRQSAALRIEAPMEVRSSPVLSEPGVVGVVRPVLLLPDGIQSRLTATQLQAVLAHELYHVRRRDNLTAAIHMLVETLFWFHPLIWWIGARLVEERERACDEGVVELGNERQAYAEGILKVCQLYMESKLACVAGVSGANLRKRVEGIMKNRMAEHLHAAKKVVLVGIGALAVTGPVLFGLLTSQTVGAQAAVAGSEASQQPVAKSVLAPAPVPASVSSIGNMSLHVFPSTAARPARFRDGMVLFQPRRSIRDTIAPAYQVQARQIVGAPAWIDSMHYDKYLEGSGLASESLPRLNQFATLERKLLTDQFGLKFHREVQWVPVYVLSVADQGRTANMRELNPIDMGQPIMVSVNPDKPESSTFPRLMNGAPLHHVVFMLSGALDSIVLDRTGLAGSYRFELPDEPSPEALPAILEKQFGLKLTRSTEQVEMFVVDAIEQPRMGS